MNSESGQTSEFSGFELDQSIGPIGAEVSGLDLALPLSEQTVADLQTAWHRHGFLVFRDQHLGPGQQAEFASYFGDLDVYPFMQSVQGHPNVIPIVKEPDATMNFGGAWHTDTSYLECPPKGTALLAIEVPKSGGDTLFSDCAAAFDDLSTGMKTFLLDNTGVYSPKLVHGAGGDYATKDAKENLGASYGGDEAFAEGEVEHPLIRRHEDSGLLSIYCGEFHTHRIKGWTRAESLPVIRFLNQHLAQDKYVSRCRWERGTLVLWDNRRLFHNALNDYQGQRRHMHRVIVKGQKPT